MNPSGRNTLIPAAKSSMSPFSGLSIRNPFTLLALKRSGARIFNLRSTIRLKSSADARNRAVSLSTNAVGISYLSAHSTADCSFRSLRAASAASSINSLRSCSLEGESCGKHAADHLLTAGAMSRPPDPPVSATFLFLSRIFPHGVAPCSEVRLRPLSSTGAGSVQKPSTDTRS